MHLPVALLNDMMGQTRRGEDYIRAQVARYFRIHARRRARRAAQQRYHARRSHPQYAARRRHPSRRAARNPD